MNFNIRTKIAQAFKVVLGPLGLNKPTREPWPKIFQVAAVIALQTLAYGIEQQIEHQILGERVANVVIAGQSWYQLMVSAYPRALSPKFSTVVHIDPRSDPTAEYFPNNSCVQRKYFADLLPVLAGFAPHVIVLDRRFLPLGCERMASNDPTERLQQAISHVTTVLHVPIILGMGIEEAPPTPSGDRTAAHVIPSLGFAPSPLLTVGILNTDRTPERLALGWTVKAQPGGSEEWVNGLALQSALVREPRLLDDSSVLKHLKGSGESPYMSLIRPENLVLVRSGDLLCLPMPSSDRSLSKRCADLKPSLQNLDHLRGKVVFVGEVGTSVDRHSTVIGDISGVDLQANALEALLDERFFPPAPAFVDIVFGILFLFAVDWALSHETALVAIARFVSVACVTLLLLALTIRSTGYYVSPLGVSALVVMKLIWWAGERTGLFGSAHAHPDTSDVKSETKDGGSA